MDIALATSTLLAWQTGWFSQDWPMVLASRFLGHTYTHTRARTQRERASRRSTNPLWLQFRFLLTLPVRTRYTRLHSSTDHHRCINMQVLAYLTAFIHNKVSGLLLGQYHWDLAWVLPPRTVLLSARRVLLIFYYSTEVFTLSSGRADGNRMPGAILPSEDGGTNSLDKAPARYRCSSAAQGNLTESSLQIAASMNKSCFIANSFQVSLPLALAFSNPNVMETGYRSLDTGILAPPRTLSLAASADTLDGSSLNTWTTRKSLTLGRSSRGFLKDNSDCTRQGAGMDCLEADDFGSKVDFMSGTGP